MLTDPGAGRVAGFYTVHFALQLRVSLLHHNLLTSVSCIVPILGQTTPPLSMEFSSQQYGNGLPFPPPGDLPDPWIKPASLASPVLAGRFFITVPAEKPSYFLYRMILITTYGLTRSLHECNFCHGLTKLL